MYIVPARAVAVFFGGGGLALLFFFFFLVGHLLIVRHQHWRYLRFCFFSAQRASVSPVACVLLS